MSSLKELFKTTQRDSKNFPATNQIHHCWQKYNEYVYCVKKAGGDEDACKKAKQLAWSVCPDEDMNTWAEQRVNGNFLGVQEREAKVDVHH